MDWVRLIHFSFGYILFAVLLLRFLIIPFRKGDRLFPNFFSKAFYENAFDALKNYLFISSSHKPYVRNPLARTAYLIFYLLVLFEIITGFAMYGKINPTGFWYSLFGFVVPLLGGEFEVHFLHHIVAWFILFFVVIHVYFVIREDVLEKNGEVSSMINGTKDFESAPADF